MNANQNVLVIGSGLAGMEAALLLAKAGKQIYLVEKLPIIGGNAIKNEESFPNLECSTCMVAPMQQEILQHPNIKTLTLSYVERIVGEMGNFTITINKKARYVNETECIGCDMCYEPCPVSVKNEWEENLIERKAIYVPCAGSLPNVPMIDTENCLQLRGKKSCNLCAEACMFEAINLADKDEKVEIQVGAIIVATGSNLFDVSKLSNFGYGTHPGIYTSMEFERLFASNGPTEGELTLRDSNKKPEKIAIIHCVGRKEQGYCSSVCCLYSIKHAHFIKHKLQNSKIYNLYIDLCVPDKTHQKFAKKIIDKDLELIFHSSIDELKVLNEESGLIVEYKNAKNKKDSLEVDMIILAPAIIPGKDASELSQISGIELDSKGFFMSKQNQIGSVETKRPGIFVIGCAEGPKDLHNSAIQAESAAGKVMSCLE